jgi:hypothetical protein
MEEGKDFAKKDNREEKPRGKPCDKGQIDVKKSYFTDNSAKQLVCILYTTLDYRVYGYDLIKLLSSKFVNGRGGGLCPEKWKMRENFSSFVILFGNCPQNHWRQNVAGILR